MTYKKSKEPGDQSFLESLDPKKYADVIRIMSSQDESSGGYVDYLTLSREEAVVHVMAHELRHLWQSGHSESDKG
jgi:hypothetical protein